jgi:hypothetical protein
MNGVSRAQGEAGVPESLGQPQLLEGRAGDSRNPTRNSLRSPAASPRRDGRASTLAVGIDVCARASPQTCSIRGPLGPEPPRLLPHAIAHSLLSTSACSSTSSVARACLSVRR